MAMYSEIVPLRTAALKAEQGYKENWKTIEQDNVARRATHEKQVEEAWDKVNQEIAEKNPEFAPRDEDNEGNEMLTTGFKLADMFFSDQRDQLSLDKKVLLDAHVRNRVAAYPRLVRDLKAMRAENEELKKDIAELRGSPPGKPGAESPETPPTEESEGAEAAFVKKFGA